VLKMGNSPFFPYSLMLSITYFSETRYMDFPESFQHWSHLQNFNEWIWASSRLPIPDMQHPLFVCGNLILNFTICNQKSILMHQWHFYEGLMVFLKRIVFQKESNAWIM
jgi:hypothetical protein